MKYINYILDIKYIVVIVIAGISVIGISFSNFATVEGLFAATKQQIIGNDIMSVMGDNVMGNSVMDDNIVRFELDNGLEVILLKDDRLPVITHTLWYRVGAVDEEKGNSGTAHYLEHLMFKGTDKFPEGQYSKIIAANGGESNAFTTFDYTAYYAQIPKEHLPLIMQMEADRMSNLNITDKKALTELEVVKEERKQRNENNPEDKHRENIFAALFEDSPYQDPIIGWDQDLEEMTSGKAFEFYKQNYMPQNAALIISGNISEPEVREFTHKYYGKIKNQRPKPDRCNMNVSMPEIKQKYLEKKHPDILKPSWSMLYNTVGANQNLRHIAALQILFYVVGGGQNSRLYKKLVFEDKSAITAGAYFSTLRYGGVAGVEITPADHVTFKKIEKDTLEQIEIVKQQNISENELRRAKTQLEARIIYKTDDQLGHALSLGKFIMNCHSIEKFKQYVQIIRDVKVQDVRNVAQIYLKDEYRLIANIDKGKETH